MMATDLMASKCAQFHNMNSNGGREEQEEEEEEDEEDEDIAEIEKHRFKGSTTIKALQRSLSSPSSSPSTFFTLPFRRRRQSYTINPPDDTYNVMYLGNVLTVMAKGDGCVEKPLNLIWRTYCGRKKSNIHMKLAVTRSGLKAETKQQGLTEYWAHRITFCLAPQEYPRLFCWVYKHEGKRMKPELRCHAVLCKKISEPKAIASKLSDFLQAALQEYRREKLCMQNVRLNATAIGKVATCPKRKLMLQTGTLNFCPPVSRSKSAPRLGSIDEEDEMPEEAQQEDDLSDLDSLCYRESPAVDDECASSSAASSSSSSSPFLRQSSLTEHEHEHDEGFNSISEAAVSDQTSGILRGALGTGVGAPWMSQRRASAFAAIGLRRHSSTTSNNSSNKDADAISDESGYQDGAINYSDDEFVLPEEEGGFDVDDVDEDECEVQVTAL